MNPVDNILVPIDFSETSRNALKYAIAIAEKAGARLTLAHAMRLIPPTPSTHRIVPGDLKSELEESVKAQFSILKEDILDFTELQYEFVTKIGFSIDVIESMASSKVYDLVVMGTNGATGLNKFFGSTTSAIIKEVDVPVIAIPPEASFHGFNYVTVASDYENLGEPYALQVLASICNDFDSEVTIVNYNNPDKISEEEMKGNLKYDSYFREGKLKYEFKSSTDVVESLLEYAAEVEPDLLVMIHKNRGMIESLFHKSVTSKTVDNINLPVMAIPS